MTGALLQRVVVPVASEADARATTAAVAETVVARTEEITVVHVIEKAGGAPDKASVEQREEAATEIFALVREQLADVDAAVETEILYGTDVAETIVKAAHDRGATAIVFTPRDGSRWVRLLTGDVALELMTESDVPVVILPDEPLGDRDG